MTDKTFPNKLPPLARAIDASEIKVRKDEGATRITFAASSETPVERWFGDEVLSHDKKAVRLDRAKRGAMPLLFNHNMDDPVGIVEAARIEDKRLVVDAKLFETERGKEFAAMLDGGLRNVSIGYRINVVEEDKKTNRFTATDWEPYEVSIVTVPADPTVGIGRQLAGDEFEVRMIRAEVPSTQSAQAAGVRSMSKPDNAAAGESAEKKTETSVEVTRDEVDVVKLEADRRAAIANLCRAYNLDDRYAQHWMNSRKSFREITDEVVKIVAERSKDETSVTFLDLSKKEKQRYSLLRALRASISKDWSKAGLELECNKEVSTRLNRIPRAETSFFVPLDVMMRDLPMATKRDMTVAGVSGSNYLVSTDNQPGSFIELLRNRSVALRMGVQRLSGLQGNVTIPKMTAGNTGYWLADENTAITESQPTIAQLALSPKNVAALTELSHQLLQQSSPDAEQLVLTSIARDIGLAVDVGILRGSGSAGQPTGIVTTAGIGSVSGTSLAAAGVLEFQSDVAANNALEPGCGYVTTAAVAALLAARPELPSTGTERLWKGNLLNGSLFDFPAMTSQQMTAATMLFGWWQSVILAEWGVLELMTNPFSDFTRGLTAVRGWYACDVGVRYAGAWSYATTIT
jgi:HK97 family phage major capsid protein/HK97 family phage prohead protease